MEYLLILIAYSLILASVLLIQKQKNIEHYFFSIAILCASSWFGALYMLSLKPSSLFWARSLFTGISLLPACLLIYILQYNFKNSAKWLKYTIYTTMALPSLLLAIYSYSSLILKEITPDHTLIYGPLHPYFCVYLCLYMILFFIITIKHIKKETGIQRLRLLYLLVGTISPFLIAIPTNVILPLLGNTHFIFVGPLAMPIFLTTITYSVVKHRLLDIKIIVTEGVALVLTCFLGILGYYMINHIEITLLKDVKNDHFTKIIYWCSFAILFHKIKTQIQTQSQKTLNRNDIDEGKIIQEMSLALTKATKLESTVSIIYETFIKLEIESTEIFITQDLNLLRKNSKKFIKWSYQLGKSFPTKDPFKENNILLNTLANQKEILYKEDAPLSIQKILAEQNKLICIPILINQSLSGFIFTGKKRKKSIYTVEDFQLLKTIEAQIELALDRLRPYEKIQKDYETSIKVAQDYSAQVAYATLTRGIAHEIRNPLAMILSGIELTQDHLSDQKTANEYLELIKTNILRLSEITSTMLHYGSPVSPKKELTAINPLLEELSNLIKGEIQIKNIEIIKELNPIPNTYIDKNSLSQSILNIILNAIQAIEKNGKITLRTEQSTFKDENRNEKNGIKISITDNGKGMSQETLSKIFDPFFSTKYKSSGLGLSLVLRIIKEHEGTIEVHSEEGKGTTFSVFIPQTMQESPDHEVVATQT